RGVLQRGAHDLGRVDHAGLDEVLVLELGGVVTEGPLALLDLRDDDRALDARVARDLAQRLLERAAHDVDAVAAVVIERQLVERRDRAAQRDAATGDDALFHGRASRVHRVLDARLLLLHLDLGRRADADDRDAADELGQTLLELLAIVIRRGLLDLAADGLHASLDRLLLTGAFD